MNAKEGPPQTIVDPSIADLAKKACPDCLPPAEIARKAEVVGVNKANLNPLNSVLLGILAGAFIGLGAMLCTLVTTQSGLEFGLNRLVGGIVFCLGLILVVVAGAELFTGNTLLVMGWFSGQISVGRVFKNWVIVYFANLVGALGLVAIVYVSQQWSLNSSLVGANAVAIANAKVNIAFWPALARGILCNALVCLAIWMCFSGKTVIDKILAIIFPITAFVAAGFEHSIANMYFIPIGILLAQEPSVLQAANLTASGVANLNLTGFITNLVPVTIGNIIGGSIMVGAIYWVTYLRQDNASFSLALQHWLMTLTPWRRPTRPATSPPSSAPALQPIPAPTPITAAAGPVSTSTRKALPELLATAVLARTVGDKSFFEKLAKSPETILKDYNLAEEEKAALSSGDITWLEKSIASLSNPMTTYAVLKKYSSGIPAKN
jgi:formate transporter